MPDQTRYADLEALKIFKEEYDIKIDEKLNEKINISQGSENAGKILTIDDSGNIIPGNPEVQKATHSSTADTATNAENAVNAEHATSADTATTADSAIKAEQDGNGNVIADTYALVDHEHSWNDLIEKPFYAESVTEEILSETELPFEENSYFGAFVNMGDTVDFTLIEGESYTVVFDDVEYECVAASASFAGSDGIAVGNFAFAGSSNNTGEPFILGCTNAGGQVLATNKTDATHKVRIYREYEDIHTLDKKYLPSDIGMQSSWLQDDESSNDYIKNRTHYSIRENNVIIISETTLLKGSFDKLSEQYASYIDVENTFNLSPDSVSCTVVWDGVEYNNVPVYYSSTFATDASVRIGIGGIGEYPFELHAYLNDDLIGYIGVYTIGLSDHTISVIGESEIVIKQLDNKYIKDSIARVDDVKKLISIKSSEIDELLSNKADKEHAHSFDEISGFVELTSDDIDAMFAK